MAPYLTQEVYQDLFMKTTSYGFTLDSCIQTGLDNPNKESCGIIAGDEECYDAFADIFDPIITIRHRGYRRGPNKHKKNMSADNLTGMYSIYHFSFIEHQYLS